MEEQIKRVIRLLNRSFGVLWGVAILLLCLGETDVLPVGMLADDVLGSYYFQTISILVTALLTPLALKLFSLVLTRKIDHLTIPVALKQYAKWSIVRLNLLGIVVLVNLLCYYMTMNNTGALCALIGLTASIFCIPSEKRLRQELHISKEESVE